MLKLPNKKIITAQPADLPSAQVAVVSPDGIFGTVPSHEISSAIEAGYREDTPEVRKDLALQKEYGEGFGNEAAAFGLGAARTLSFGLSDLALKNSGLVSAERLRETKERNPNATTAGELGAFAVPLGGQILGAMKGAGTVAQGVGLGARLAGGAVSGVNAAGAEIAKAVTGVTGSKLIGGAAQAAGEAFAYNVAKNLSESVLGEKEITAQRLLANSGTALAVGAGLGLGIPLATKAAQATAQKAKAALSALGGTVREKILPAAADAAARGYSDIYGAATGGGQGVADDVYATISGGFTPAKAKEREAFVKAISPEAADDMDRVFIQQLTDTHHGVEAAKDILYKDIRPREMDMLLDGVELNPALEDFGRLINVVNDTAKKMADDPLLYNQTYMRELKNVGIELEKRAGSTKGGAVVGFDNAAELHSFVDSVKKTALSDLRFGNGGTDRSAKNAIAEISKVYQDFASHLENPAIYGDAGARQGSVNEAVSTYLREMPKKNSQTGPGSFKRFWMDSSGNIDVAKVKANLRKIGTGRDRDIFASLDRYMSAASAVVDQAEKGAVNIGSKDIDRAGFESLVKKLGDTRLKAADDLATVNKIRSQDAFGMALMNFQKTVGDSLFRDGVFSGVVKIAQRAASPFGVAKTLSTAEGLVMNTSKRASETVGRLVGRLGSAAGKAGAAAAPYVAPAGIKSTLSALIGDDNNEPGDDFHRASVKLAALAADPAGTAEKLSAGVSQLSPHAPELAQSVIDTQMRAISFLDEKAPKNDAAQFTLNPFVQSWQPSDGEISKWKRYAAAVQDPLSVLDELEHGTVSAEAVEAVQAVYPALFEDLKMQLMTKVGELKTTVPYRDRVQLSLLFDVALDPSLDPSFVNTVQNGYGQAASQADSAKPAYRSSSASKKLGANEETTAQRIARR